MSQVEVECGCISKNEENDRNDRNDEYEYDNICKGEFNFYPALLVSQLGIDKGTKDKGLGYYIILYCLGLGQLLSQKVGCAF